MEPNRIQPQQQLGKGNLCSLTVVQLPYRCICCLTPCDALHTTKCGRESDRVDIELCPCLVCGSSVVDLYCEREWFLVILDMVLLRPWAYRHLLCNRIPHLFGSTRMHYLVNVNNDNVYDNKNRRDNADNNESNPPPNNTDEMRQSQRLDRRHHLLLVIVLFLWNVTIRACLPLVTSIMVLESDAVPVLVVEETASSTLRIASTSLLLLLVTQLLSLIIGTFILWTTSLLQWNPSYIQPPTWKAITLVRHLHWMAWALLIPTSVIPTITLFILIWETDERFEKTAATAATSTNPAIPILLGIVSAWVYKAMSLHVVALLALWKHPIAITPRNDDHKNGNNKQSIGTSMKTSTLTTILLVFILMAVDIALPVAVMYMWQQRNNSTFVCSGFQLQLASNIPLLCFA